MSAPRSSSALTASALPDVAASINGVAPVDGQHVDVGAGLGERVDDGRHARPGWPGGAACSRPAASSRARWRRRRATSRSSVGVAAGGRPVQRGHAVALRLVDVHALLEQGANASLSPRMAASATGARAACDKHRQTHARRRCLHTSARMMRFMSAPRRDRGTDRRSIQFERPGAVAEAVDFDAELLQHRQHDVRHRRSVGRLEMQIALDCRRHARPGTSGQRL